MICFKPIRDMVMFAPFFIPTLALSEPVTIGYFARVELVMLAPENASFECASSDRPAQIEINEDTSGVAATNFPTSLLDRPEPPEPSVRVRRGTEVVPERVDRIPTRLRNGDWSVTTSGNIDFCVGHTTLKVIGGSLDIFANLGRYEGGVISSDNVMQDLDIEYAVNASGMDPILFVHSVRAGWPSEMMGQIVGSGARVDGRFLGRLDFDASQLTVRFTNQSDLDDVTHLTRLNVRLLLVEAGLPSDFPIVIHKEIIEDDG